MASELYVETLKGLTSGANANKVIVPAGQTLDITDWSPPAGTVLQTVQTSSSADESTTSTSFVDSNLSVNITPSSTSSKILVFYYTSIRKAPGDANNAIFIQLLRNSTPITYQDYVGWNQLSQYGQEGVSVCHLDSPNTTSQITYKVQFRTNNASYSVAFAHDTSDHGIVVQEIAG